MTPSLPRLKALVELAEKATPGPWFAGYWSGSCRKPEHLGNHPGPRGDNPCVYEYDLIGGEYFGRYVSAGTKDARIGIVYSSEEPTLTREDAEFIAAARNAIPDLIALLAQGQGEAVTMTMQNPATCYICGAPAFCSVDINIGACAAGAGNMKPVCDKHNPYAVFTAHPVPASKEPEEASNWKQALIDYRKELQTDLANLEEHHHNNESVAQAMRAKLIAVQECFARIHVASNSAPPLGSPGADVEAAAREILTTYHVRAIGPDAGKRNVPFSEIAAILTKHVGQPKEAPLDVLLFCPKCGKQHIDAPEPKKGWTNPPHRKHLCHYCGLVWLAALVPTNGVTALSAASPPLAQEGDK